MIDFETKIDIIKGYTDEEVCNFTGNKKIIVEKIRQGYKAPEIAKKLGCSRQNIYSLIDSAVNPKAPIRSKAPSKPGTPSKLNVPSKKHNFENYTDFSTLSNREYQIVSLLLKNPNIKYREIGDELGISAGAVGAAINRAAKKLSGRWEEERTKINERQKKYRERHLKEEKERNKRYYENNRDKLINGMKEYNREYYQKNKEKILEKRAMKGKQ